MGRAGMNTKPFVVLCVCLGLGTTADCCRWIMQERVNGRRGVTSLSFFQPVPLTEVVLNFNRPQITWNARQ